MTTLTGRSTLLYLTKHEGEAIVDGRLAPAVPTEIIHHVNVLVKDTFFKILLRIVFKKLNSLSKWSSDFVTIGLTLINAFFLFFIFICDNALILGVE